MSGYFFSLSQGCLIIASTGAVCSVQHTHTRVLCPSPSPVKIIQLHLVMKYLNVVDVSTHVLQYLLYCSDCTYRENVQDKKGRKLRSGALNATLARVARMPNLNIRKEIIFLLLVCTDTALSNAVVSVRTFALIIKY